MTSFTDLVKARRSANKFDPNVTISPQELDDMFNLVKFAPSAFNLSAVIAVLGDLEAYHNVGPINEGLLSLGVIDQRGFEETVSSVTHMYESRGDTFKRDEAIRNASLSAMLFMLIAKDRGWDTCPMIGFDPEALRKVLNIPDRYVPAMLITIGKEDTGRQRPRGYRKPVAEFVTYDGFN
ncbi:hypothetical protein BGX30_003921 [Mortierella sp. GBA39]|nr:hypothetical protein BGX30_003921 [Mortierella sp. GBA39]